MIMQKCDLNERRIERKGFFSRHDRLINLGLWVVLGGGVISAGYYEVRSIREDYRMNTMNVNSNERPSYFPEDKAPFENKEPTTRES
jgi:hypothetical protein